MWFLRGTWDDGPSSLVIWARERKAAGRDVRGDVVETQRHEGRREERTSYICLLCALRVSVFQFSALLRV